MSTRKIAAFAVSFPPGRVYSSPVSPKLWLGLSLTEATSNDGFCAGGAGATTGITVAARATKFLLTCRISSWMRCQNPVIQFDSEARLQQSEKRLIEVGDHCMWVCYDTSATEIALTGIHHIQLAMPPGGEDGEALLPRRIHGSRICSHKWEPLEGYAHIYVNDPFGNRLELLQPISLRDSRSAGADRP